jgi:hypothetical protein
MIVAVGAGVMSDFRDPLRLGGFRWIGGAT